MAKKKEAEDSRNIRRTKTALRNSLIELMKTRSILRISVKEICNKADVGRTTFYAHYQSQYDLLEEIEIECQTVFEETLFYNLPIREYTNKEIILMTEKILLFIADNSNSIQTLLSENGDITFQRRFINRFIILFKNTKKHYTDNSVNEETAECYSVFFVHGAIALVQYWLKTNMRKSISELAKILVSLTNELRQ